MPDDQHPTYRSGLGASDADHIWLLGHDLGEKLLGKVTFGELAYWMTTKRRPTEGQRVLFEAVLVALADHGFTPTAIAARVTLLSAPDSLQGAIAAGLLGGGSRFLGVTEDAAEFLAAALADLDEHPTTPDGWDEVASRLVADAKEAGRFVPGLGHPVHKNGDPRTPVLFGLAREHDVFGPHLALFEAIGRAHPDVLGRTLPLNGAGVCGAVLADIDIPLGVTRGVALLARCAGLLGQLSEELVDPIGMDIYTNIDRHTDYQPPDH
ncbi:MAG: citryl-CoA lyase [Acidimicrobiaceae bacterium]|nr:citryl-CoA lyase [Acidimicrobiaceae bacterium]